jgi:hypothetical protein
VSRKIFTGRVGEWLKPADCKSAAPCGLRRFESSPVHHCIATHGEWLDKTRKRIQREASEIQVPAKKEKRDGPATFLFGFEWYAGQPERAWVAQLVERVLGKDEVTGSIPVPGSRSQEAERSFEGSENFADRWW